MNSDVVLARTTVQWADALLDDLLALLAHRCTALLCVHAAGVALDEVRP
jgi:hypothetical protein